jgi:TonB family protein
MNIETTDNRDEDDTGIDLDPSERVVRSVHRSEKIRVGRWVLPSVTVAGAVSVMVHAGVIALACLVVRLWGTAPGLTDRWAGGGSLGGIAPDAGSTQVAIESKPPPMTDSASRNPPLRTVVMEDASDELPDWNQSKGATVPDPNAEKPESQIIGIAGVALTDAAPVRARHQHTSAAPPSGQSSSQGISTTPPTSPAGPDSAGGISGPGLPGAMAGKGLPTPAYPLESRRRGQQGVVRVELEILPDGKVGQIRVTSDPGFPLLRDAALTAAEKLRAYPFTPARRFGIPITDHLIIPYAFSLR